MVKKCILLACMILTGLTACSEQKEIKMGSYTCDAQFLEDHGIRYVGLKSRGGSVKVTVIPSWQGHVMTTSVTGDEGNSYGWISYRFIEAGKQSGQLNPVGGEERFWLGSEGGPYPLCFANGKEQVYGSWKVSAVIDTKTSDVVESNNTVIQFRKSTSVKNTSGTILDLGINRKVSLLSKTSIEQQLGIIFPTGTKLMVYESLDKIISMGKKAWTRKNGLTSVWMLSHFDPTPTTTVFVPSHENAKGKTVDDEYFGKVPVDRLKTKDSILYSKIDGKLRLKLGIPLMRSKGLCCSYDPEEKVLIILRCSTLKEPGAYLNGQWGKQDAPFTGDMLNACNGDPVEDGSIMRPFYEIETSSPGAKLTASESLLRKWETFHIRTEETTLNPVVEKLLGVDLKTIRSQFQ